MDAWLAGLAANHERIGQRHALPPECPCVLEAELIDAAGELLVRGLNDDTLPPGTYLCELAVAVVCQCRDRVGGGGR